MIYRVQSYVFFCNFLIWRRSERSDGVNFSVAYDRVVDEMRAIWPMRNRRNRAVSFLPSSRNTHPVAFCIRASGSSSSFSHNSSARSSCFILMHLRVATMAVRRSHRHSDAVRRRAVSWCLPAASSHPKIYGADRSTRSQLFAWWQFWI